MLIMFWSVRKIFFCFVCFAVVNREDLTEDEFFEPEAFEDFPTRPAEKPVIPHIIHQTYKDEYIPEVFSSYVKSFETKNPSWKYYFWTDKSARQLIAERHSLFLPVWDSYRKNIFRADALRYFVLYEFGGIYADLDVECLRPLDRVTNKYAAIFPPEPVEHSARYGYPFIINNAIMISRPKHPFLKQIIDSLSHFQPMGGLLDVAGPLFLTTQFMIYNKYRPGDAFKQRAQDDSSAPYFYKAEPEEDDVNAVYVPNTHFFMHTLNFVGRSRLYYNDFCKQYYNNNDVIVRRACHEFWLRKTKQDPNRFTFTEHHWYQSYNRLNFLSKYIHIGKIFQNYTIYN